MVSLESNCALEANLTEIVKENPVIFSNCNYSICISREKIRIIVFLLEYCHSSTFGNSSYVHNKYQKEFFLILSDP